MALTLVTAPAVEPLTLAEAKRHLRVEHDDENDLIVDALKAAREFVETFTGRVLITQTWDLKLAAFPCGAIHLPMAPVSAVSTITYLDTAGASQTWSASLYRTSLPTGPKAMRGCITPAYGESYPSTYGVVDAVAVRFVAGYGTTGAALPAALRQAIKVVLTHVWSERWAAATGAASAPVPAAAEALLWGYRVF